MFVFNRAFVAAAGCAFWRSKTGGRVAVRQPSSVGNAVVEHKAQTRFEGFLHTSLLLSTTMCDAPGYFREDLVRHLAIAMYSAI